MSTSRQSLRPPRTLSEIAAFNTQGNKETISSSLHETRRTRSTITPKKGPSSSAILCPSSKTKTKVKASSSSSSSLASSVPSTPSLPTSITPLPTPGSRLPSPELPPIALPFLTVGQLSPLSSMLIDDAARDNDDASYSPPSPSPNSSNMRASMHHIEQLTSTIQTLEANKHKNESSNWKFPPSQSLREIMNHKRLSLRVPQACRQIFIEGAKGFLQPFSDSLHAKSDPQSIFYHFVNLLLLPSLCFTACRGSSKRKYRKNKVLKSRIRTVIDALQADDRILPTLLANTIPENDTSTFVEDPIRNHVQFANTLVNNSYIGQAIRSLARSCYVKKIVRTKDELYQELLALHPQPNTMSDSNYPELPEDIAPVHIEANSSAFISILESLDNGSSAGVSGWNGNYLRVLSQDSDCRHHLAHFFTQALCGKLPFIIRELFLTSMLIGLDKPNGGIRPIAIGELFARAISKYALSLISTKDLQSIFQPHQFGVGTNNGCETVVHTVQQALSHPDTPYVAMCIDFKNAFNTVNRSTMISELFKHRALRPLWSFCHWCYSSPTNLAVRNGNDSYDLSELLASACGCRQGSPESSLLFAVAIQPLLIAVSKKFPSIKIVAYLDDITILGPDAATVIEAYNYLVKEAKETLDLVVQVQKCQFIYFNNGSASDYLDSQTYKDTSPRVELERYGITIKCDAAEILGTAVGCDESKLHNLNKRIGESHNELFTLIQHLSLSVRNAMLLLRYCMIPKLTYLVRTVAPIVIDSIIQTFDDYVIDTALKILDIEKDLQNDNNIRQRVINQLRSSLRTGGFGLTSMSSICHAAFLSSLSKCLYTDNGSNAHHLFQSPSSKLLSNIQFSIDKLYISSQHDDLQTLIPPNAVDYINKYSNDASNIHLQAQLVQAAHNNTHRALIKEFEDAHDEFNLARIKNITANGASIWKICTSNNNNGYFQGCTDTQYRINARLHLGLFPHRNLPNICGSCSKQVRINSSVQDAMHLLCCNHIKSSEITDRHNQIQQAVEYYANCCNIRVKRYVCNRNGVNNTKVDTTLALGSVLLILIMLLVHQPHLVMFINPPQMMPYLLLIDTNTRKLTITVHHIHQTPILTTL